MSKLRKCPAGECDGGVFVFKFGPMAGKFRPCYRCAGKGTVDLEAEKAAKALAARAMEAAEMLRSACRERTGRVLSLLESEMETGLMSLETYEPDRLLKLWESVYAGRIDACITALVQYGKDNPLPPSQ